jgi:hypothetical protein
MIENQEHTTAGRTPAQLVTAEARLVSRACEIAYSTTDWTTFTIQWHEAATERDRLLVCETIVSVENIDPSDAVETWLDRLSIEQIRSKFLPCTYDDRRFFVALGKWIRVACGETAEIEGDENED